MVLFEEVLGLRGNLLVLFSALLVLAKARASDIAINNSVRVADITGLGRTRIGFILVAFSASLPELLVSVFAAIRQESVGVAVGNVLGSNIVNVCLILGICFLLVTLKCPKYLCLYQSMAKEEVRSLYFGLFISSTIQLILLYLEEASRAIAHARFHSSIFT